MWIHVLSVASRARLWMKIIRQWSCRMGWFTPRMELKSWLLPRMERNGCDVPRRARNSWLVRWKRRLFCRFWLIEWFTWALFGRREKEVSGQFVAWRFVERPGCGEKEMRLSVDRVFLSEHGLWYRRLEECAWNINDSDRRDGWVTFSLPPHRESSHP